MTTALVFDFTQQYADRVGAVIRDNPEGLTVVELARKTTFSQNIVRRALDRLVFTNEIRVELRHVPQRRGQMPRVYKPIAPKQ